MSPTSYGDEATLYQVSQEWYEAQDRSLDQVLSVRMCANHRSDRSAPAGERRRAVPDPETGELRFVATAGDDTFETIAQCCATQSDFITPTMPLMEAIFRVFLAKGNPPLSAEEIHDELRAWFAGNTRSRYFTVETVAKLLESDNYYGVQPLRAEVGTAG
jgi:hypothetical protein